MKAKSQIILMIDKKIFNLLNKKEIDDRDFEKNK